jgi:hypothetical protein
MARPGAAVMVAVTGAAEMTRRPVVVLQTRSPHTSVHPKHAHSSIRCPGSINRGKMRRAAASILIAASLTLGISAPALAQSGTTHPTAKRCLTRACRDNHARRTAEQAESVAGARP